METDDIHFLEDELKIFSNCIICPHQCSVNRFESSDGWCRSGAGLSVASVGPHYGEEPIISGKHGICNVFFVHCNLQCMYCQNFQISCNSLNESKYEMNFNTLIDKICYYLRQGCHAVGFVSPSHMVPYVKMTIRKLRNLGKDCVFVYNSNGYDKPETLRSLEGLIDVYLPDLKYMQAGLSQQFSGVDDYPEVAGRALKEMYRQKGSTVILDDEGQALSGLIVRHLVLPGHIENSKEVLRFIAGEISPRVHISLMSQFYPVYNAVGHSSLGRVVSRAEYQEVVDEMDRLGLERGWVQEPDSPEYYLPDFGRDTPFES